MKLSRNEIAMIMGRNVPNCVFSSTIINDGLVFGLRWLHTDDCPMENMYYLMKYKYNTTDTSCYVKTYKFTRQSTIVSDVKWIDLNDFDPERQFSDLLSK